MFVCVKQFLVRARTHPNSITTKSSKTPFDIRDASSNYYIEPSDICTGCLLLRALLGSCVSTLSRRGAGRVQRLCGLELAVSRVGEGRAVGVNVFSSVFGEFLRGLCCFVGTSLKVLLDILSREGKTSQDTRSDRNAKRLTMNSLLVFFAAAAWAR